MNDLKDVIEKYKIETPVKHLGKEKTFDLDDNQFNDLRNDLNKISVKNGAIFWAIFGVILALFIASVVFVVYNQDNPERLKVIFGITGVSVMGLILLMIKFWKEKNYIDMTLVLVRTLDKENANAILVALLQKL